MSDKASRGLKVGARVEIVASETIASCYVGMCGEIERLTKPYWMARVKLDNCPDLFTCWVEELRVLPSEGRSCPQRCSRRCSEVTTAKLTREHGSRSRYCAGCRCDDCTHANRVYNRKWARKRSKELGRKPRVAKHGTYSKYRRGCRCDDCMEARRLYRRVQNYAAGVCSPKVPSAGLKPLVECLASFGFMRDRIALAAGVSVTTLRLKRPTIQLERAKRIESLHWGLHRRHAPFRQHCRCNTDLIALGSFEEAA